MTKGIIIFLIGIFILSIIMNGAANWLESKPLPPEQKFSIADTYHGCNVVRYTPDHSARYFYFLDCKK